MTRNDCYTANRKIIPKGIMIHSTAAPGVMASDWFSRWNKSYRAGEINRQACVHAFIDSTEIYQYLPWNHRGWHAGGEANNTHIGLEICEPGGFSYSKGFTMIGYESKKYETYFRKAWNNAVSLCVYLCKEYNFTEKDIICHSEGHQLGIASNHADVMHWFPKHGENMNTFREAVKAELEAEIRPEADDFEAGNIVDIKAVSRTYYPGGPIIPNWVKWNYHMITQDESGGKPVIKGGKECVLLGKTILKSTMDEKAGIMTWVDKDNLEIISSGVEVEPEKETGEKYYRVQVGAFSEKKNTETLMARLKEAGFDAIVKYE